MNHPHVVSIVINLIKSLYCLPPMYLQIHGHPYDSKKITIMSPLRIEPMHRGDMILKIFTIMSPPRIGPFFPLVVTTLLDLIFLFMGFNQINNNVYAMSLARTHREMQTSFFEIGVQYGPRACGPRSILNPYFSEFGLHFPMRPRQTHRIPSIRPRQTHSIISFLI